MQVFVYHLKVFGDIFKFVTNCLFLYLTKEALRPIWLIPCQFTNIIMSRFLKNICQKTFLVIIFIQRDTRDHFHQKWHPILLYCSQFSPVIYNFRIIVFDTIKKNYVLIPLQIWKFFYIINIHNNSSDIIVELNTFSPCNFILYSIIINVYKFKGLLSII